MTGPSRGGKTRLMQELELLIVGRSKPNDGKLPVVMVNATNCSQGGLFSTKSFTLRALNAVNHPFYGGGEDPSSYDADYFARIQRTPETILRPALEKAIRYRGVVFLFVDEAQHVLYAKGRAAGAAAILDSWKCLAATTGVVLVLVGAYPLLDAISLCPHLIGRKRQVHLPRYLTDADDRAEFDAILRVYDAHLRLGPGLESLTEMSDYLYDGSFGCIGLLEGWIREALAVAHAGQHEFLTKDHFGCVTKLTREREMIAKEIAEGERLLADMRAPGEESPTVSPSNKRKPKGKPFRRNPRRYKTGGTE